MMGSHTDTIVLVRSEVFGSTGWTCSCTVEMDLLAIAFVFSIAGMHYSPGKILRASSGATSAEVESQESDSNATKQNLFVPKCLDVHNPITRKQILDKHNDVRRNVNPTSGNMLKMIWSQQAAENAERWGNGCDYKHSPPDTRTLPSCDCGENLVLSPGPMNWIEVIDLWTTGEAPDFTYGVGGVPGKKVGHYTQAVHAKSYYLGCSVVPCYTWYYFICQYCPAGNLAHALSTPYELGEPCSTCKNDCDDKLCINRCFFFDKARNCKDLKPYCKSQEITKMCEATCKC